MPPFQILNKSQMCNENDLENIDPEIVNRHASALERHRKNYDYESGVKPQNILNGKASF